MTDYQSAEIIAEELNMTVNKVCAMISEGRCFRDFESRAERERDLSDEDAPDVYDKHDKGDRTADPGIVVPNALFMDEVIDAIQVLPYKQQQMLYLSSGISCIACGRICNRRTYAELANGFELYSESAVEKQRKQQRSIIAANQKDVVNIDEAITHINNNLQSIGITDFHIVKCEGESAYRISRAEEGEERVFNTLSEGEKMLISFLYFIGTRVFLDCIGYGAK